MLVLSLAMAVVVVLCGARDALAYTLTLTFPDGQAMTYGSACAGAGCLARGDGLHAANAAGEVALPGRPDAVEYRREGIAPAQAPPGGASGRVAATGDRDSVVLPRLLAGTAPAIDAAESDLVARINEAREARGLPLAQLNDHLAASADLQAAWLARSAVTWAQPELMHVGPFATTLAFRHAEASLPDPEEGGEVAEVGGSSREAVADWMASAPHRASLLEPGRLLIGAARAESFIVVQTHPRCGGCAQGGTGVRSAAGEQPPAVATAPEATTPASSSSSGVALAPPCAGERLAVRRLAADGRRVRVRVRTTCLRAGHRYVLVARRSPSGRVLASRAVKRAGTMTLRLRPAAGTRSLRFALERDRRSVATRSLSLR